MLGVSKKGGRDFVKNARMGERNFETGQPSALEKARNRHGWSKSFADLNARHCKIANNVRRQMAWSLSAEFRALPDDPPDGPQGAHRRLEQPRRPA